MAGPMILMDQPDDCHCEERGWVEATVSEGEARDLLAPFCGEYPPDRPIGPAERVWLCVDDASLPDEQQRWTPCEPAAEGALEFWQFDATNTEKLAEAA